MGTSGYFPDPYDCSVFHYCNGKEMCDSFSNRSVELQDSKIEANHCCALRVVSGVHVSTDDDLIDGTFASLFRSRELRLAGRSARM